MFVPQDHFVTHNSMQDYMLQIHTCVHTCVRHTYVSTYMCKTSAGQKILRTINIPRT